MNSSKELVSVVLCTYNGEKYLKEQLDSLVNQTYTNLEILIQDDNSTDSTPEIIKEYAAKFPNIRFSTNDGPRGVNNNFFSAINKASADLIATCDQDDIWAPDKIEKQVAAIGSNLMCLARSRAFREDNSLDHYDARMPNYHLIRMIYISVAGHDMMFRKKLLRYIPDNPSAYGYLYDHVLSFTAASLNNIAVVNEILVKFRRHRGAATFSSFDKRRTKGIGNAIYIISWSIANYFKVKPEVEKYFRRKLNLLRDIKSEGPVKDDAIRIMEYEAGLRKPMLPGLAKYHYKYNEVLFYTKGKGLTQKARALLFGIMHLYNYKHLIPSDKQ